MDIASETTVIFVALQGLKAFDDADHLFIGHSSPEERGIADLSEVGLGVERAVSAFRPM